MMSINGQGKRVAIYGRVSAETAAARYAQEAK